MGQNMLFHIFVGTRRMGLAYNVLCPTNSNSEFFQKKLDSENFIKDGHKPVPYLALDCNTLPHHSTKLHTGLKHSTSLFCGSTLTHAASVTTVTPRFFSNWSACLNKNLLTHYSIHYCLWGDSIVNTLFCLRGMIQYQKCSKQLTPFLYFSSSDRSKHCTIWFSVSSTIHICAQLPITPHDCQETSDEVRSHHTSHAHSGGEDSMHGHVWCGYHRGCFLVNKEKIMHL